MRRRKINQVFDPVLSVQIFATKVQRLVYFLAANRPVRYKKGYSRIVYIGTTERGVRRIATSAAHRMAEIKKKKLNGIRRLDAYIVWVKSKQGPRAKKGITHWGLLERAMFLRFRELFCELPRLNKIGHKIKEKHEFNTFSKQTIDRVPPSFTQRLRSHSHSGTTFPRYILALLSVTDISFCIFHRHKAGHGRS